MLDAGELHLCWQGDLPEVWEMKTLAIIAAVLIAATAFAGPEKYLWALGEIESGNNDLAHGSHGEFGRYQCVKAVGRNDTGWPFSDATNATIAANVTLAIIRARTGQNPLELTPAQFAKAWHFPSSKNLNREQRDYVERFTNLTNK